MLRILSSDDGRVVWEYNTIRDFQTANGVARVAPVTLDRVRVDDITLRDVPAAVADKGALPVNLLGMSFLSRLTRFEIEGHQLVLVQ